MVHSGFGGAVLLDDQFVQANKFHESLETVSGRELKDSFGNILKTVKAALPKLKIGEFGLNDVPVEFFEGAIGQRKMSLIGCEVLRRFHILVDLKESKIYLKPNQAFSSSFVE